MLHFDQLIKSNLCAKNEACDNKNSVKSQARNLPQPAHTLKKIRLQSLSRNGHLPEYGKTPSAIINFCKANLPTDTFVSKHRKNCECCPGHYLIVDHYSSI